MIGNVVCQCRVGRLVSGDFKQGIGRGVWFFGLARSFELVASEHGVLGCAFCFFFAPTSHLHQPLKTIPFLCIREHFYPHLL